MYLVEKPVLRPMHCAVSPIIHEDPDGFIDTRAKLPAFDNHVYVSVKMLKEMVRFMGWPTPEAHEALKEKLEHRHREINELKDQLAEADVELNAVEVLRQSGNWVQGKRAGRPRKEKVTSG